MKKRVKKTELKVSAVGTPGLSSERLLKLMDAESAMQADMRDILETDERRNDLEAYIFTMRDRIAAGGEYAEYASAEERNALEAELTKAENWLYDSPEATKLEYVEKLDDLKRMAEPVTKRSSEGRARPESIQAVQGAIGKYRGLLESAADKFSHIAPERLAKISAACDDLERWLTDLRAKQGTLPMHVEPVLLCGEMDAKAAELAKMADEILSEPAPTPPREEKEAQRQEEATGEKADDGEESGESTDEGQAGSE
mmetsp:Transcript_105387/g.303090  ORF Transcript_105387/g.303090 Transcript_105387/m.303090 type:complete len:256 (+) Transcript_105387:1-768(+)